MVSGTHIQSSVFVCWCYVLEFPVFYSQQALKTSDG